MEHETDKELIFRLLYHVTSLETMWSKTFIWNWTRIYCVDLRITLVTKDEFQSSQESLY